MLELSFELGKRKRRRFWVRKQLEQRNRSVNIHRRFRTDFWVMWLSMDGGWAAVGSELGTVVGIRTSRSLNLMMKQPPRAFSQAFWRPLWGQLYDTSVIGRIAFSTDSADDFPEMKTRKTTNLKLRNVWWPSEKSNCRLFLKEFHFIIFNCCEYCEVLYMAIN